MSTRQQNQDFDQRSTGLIPKALLTTISLQDGPTSPDTALNV
jgi:hypothetical protein